MTFNFVSGGKEPLWLAISRALGSDDFQLDVLGFLIDHGADVNQEFLFSTEHESVYGVTPLEYVFSRRFQRGRTELITLLLENGADPNLAPGTKAMRGDSYGEDSRYPWPVKLLNEAVRAEETDLVELFLAHGADPNDGLSLFSAIGMGRLDLVSLIINHGANVNITSSAGIEGDPSTWSKPQSALFAPETAWEIRPTGSYTPYAYATLGGHFDIERN